MRTFSIIKPDATKRNITGAINTMIENAGFRIIAQKRMWLSQKQAEMFYDVHAGKPFYNELVAYMTSGPVIVQVLEKNSDNCVDEYRALMGATDPTKAEPNTIRGKFGESLNANAVHGSDSQDNAIKEIQFFFSTCDIFA